MSGKVMTKAEIDTLWYTVYLEAYTNSLGGNTVEINNSDEALFVAQILGIKHSTQRTDFWSKKKVIKTILKKVTR